MMISYTNVFTLAVILAVTLPIGVRGADPTFDLKTTAGTISSSPWFIEAATSTSLTITCDITADTEPNVSGFKTVANGAQVIAGTWDSGNKKMKDVKLYFTQQLTEDAKFSCYVQDSNGANFKASTEITLDLIEVSVTNKEVKSGASSTLTCTATGLSASATFVWKDSADNTVSGTTGSISGGSQSSEVTVTPSTDTTYKCIVSSQNSVNSITKTANLKVFGVTTTADKVAKSAQGTIKCEVDGTDNAPTISFKDKDGNAVSTGSGITVNLGSWDSGAKKQTATLQVSAVTADVTYSCVVKSSEYTNSEDQVVPIEIKMFDMATPETYMMKEVGTALTITCTVTGDNTVDIKWKNTAGDDKTSLATQDSYVTGSSTRVSRLKITSLVIGDSTTFTCYTSFGDSEEVKKTIQLHVIQITGLAAQGVEEGTTATFTCTYTKFTKNPVAQWFRYVNGGTDVEITGSTANAQITAGDDNSKLELSSTTYSQTGGEYYCKVAWSEVDAKSFQATKVKLYVRTLTAKPTTPTYVHTGDGISLVCSLKVAGEAEIKSSKFYRGTGNAKTELVSNDGFESVAYGSELKTIKFVKASGSVLKTDGNTYTCEFEFNTGATISAAAVVAIHKLTAFQAMLVNQEKITCNFEGTNDPIIKWYQGASSTEISTSDTTDAYTIADGSFTNNADSSTLTIDLTKITDVTAITCKITFSGITDPIETSTKLHYRVIKELSDTTYTIGAAASISCTLNYGPNGIGPDTVDWEGFHSSKTKDTHYSIDVGKNEGGERTTTLTFASPNDINYAATYTCKFTYNTGPLTYTKNVELVVRLSAVEKAVQNIHADSSFSIKCTFTGNETPSGVIWTFNTGTTITDGNGYSLAFANKVATLTKSSLTTANTGNYKCLFDMATKKSFQPSSTSNVYVVRIDETSPKTYTTGEAVTLSCVLNFGNGGTGPNDVTWTGTGISSLSSSEYAIDKGSDSSGKRKTTLTFAKVDKNAYASVYTCKFVYTGVHTHESTAEVVVRLAMVNKPIQYFKDTDASFKITCTFTGNETPTSAEWTHKTQAITSGQGGYTFDYVSGNKQSTLTKTSPTRTTDDGDYQCKFKMAMETSHEPTSKSAVTVVHITVSETWTLVGKASDTITCEVTGGIQPTDFTFSDGTTVWSKSATANKGTVSGISWVSASTKFTGTLSLDNTYCSAKATKTITCSVTYTDQTVTMTTPKNCFTTRFIVTSPTNKALNKVDTVVYTSKVISVQKPAEYGFQSSSFGDNYRILEGTWDASTNSVTATLTLTKPTTDVTFSCVASDSDGDGQTEKSISYTLDAIDITATNYPVVSGSTATVTCVASNVIGNAAPASATITLNGVANTQVTHTGNKVTSEITITQDTTYTCTFTWTGAATDAATTSAVSTTVVADVVAVQDVEVATTAGGSVTLYCDVKETHEKATEVQIIYGGTTYSTAATDQSKKATFSVNTDAQSKAEVKIDSVSSDGTYDCVFKWGTVAEIRKNGLHIDIVTISVEQTYTHKGDDSAAIICKVDNIRSGHASSPVSAFSFTDGTKTWSAGANVADEATASAIKWSGGVFTGELTLRKQYFTADKSISCTAQYGYSSLTASAVADVFELSKTSWVLTTGQSATVTCTISGIRIDPTVKWDTVDNDHTVATDSWVSTTGYKKSTLLAKTVTQDTSYECTFVINGKDYKMNVDADVVVLTGKGNAAVAASTASPQCCVTGAKEAPKSLLFKDSTKTFTVTETGHVLQNGAYSGGNLCNTLTYTTTSTDHVFTCVLSMYQNELSSATAKVDIFSFVTPYKMKLVELGTDLVLSVTTTGWDSKPTITWSAGGVDYVTGSSSSVVEGTNGNGEVNTLTLAASKVTADIAVKLTLTFPNNAIVQTLTHDVFELTKSDDMIVQKGNSSSVWCQVTKYNSDLKFTPQWTTTSSTTTTKQEDLSNGQKTTLTNSKVEADVTYTCSYAFTTAGGDSLGTFKKEPFIDYIETPTTEDYIEVGADAKITCKVTNSKNDGHVAFEMNNRVIAKLPTQEGDWCKYGDIGTASYEATTSSTIDAVKTACNGNTACKGFIHVGANYHQITSSTATFHYVSGQSVYFKETCPTIKAITPSALNNGEFSSIMTAPLSVDTKVDCQIKIGTFTFKALSSVDTFVLSGKNFVTVENEPATVVGTITGSSLALNSQDMYWSEEDGQGKKTVGWTNWDKVTQSRSTTLLIDGVAADTTFTANFVVNGRKWTHMVKVDVIKKSVTGTTVKAGSATTLTCGYSGQATAHAKVWWSGSFTGKLSETEQVTGYEFGKSSSGGYTYTTMKVVKADADATYTCNHEWESNALSWTVKSDTFTISSSSFKTEKGTTASLTCSVAGTDKAPTSWKWRVGATDYTASTETGVTMTTSTFASGEQNNKLQLANQNADSTVTCKVALDGKDYEEPIPVDVIEISTKSTTVKLDAAATITCDVKGSSSEPTDIYWEVSGGATYKSTTTATGFTVIKSAFTGGNQHAELRIASAKADQTYTCKVDYPTNSFTKTATVDVYKLTTSQVTTEVLSGKAATFTCTVTESKTAPAHITWTVDGSVASPTDTAHYKINTPPYAGETMQSTLVIVAAAKDSSIVCSTKVESDGVAPAINMDVYQMAPQETLSFNTVESVVAMKLTGLNTDIDLKRVAWFLGTTQELTDAAIYTKSRTWDAAKKEWVGKLAIKAGTATAGAKTSYLFRLDGIADYSVSSTLDVATIKYEPSTINLVLGTAYKFTVTLTGYSADYSSKLKWMLDTTALTAEAPVWKADTKTLTSIVNAVGAKAGAANILKFHMTTDYSVSEATAKIEVSEIHYESHVQIKSGASLGLTCKVTNSHSDITQHVVWTNEGKTLATAGDITITPTYTAQTKIFQSELKVTNYKKDDTVYTCAVTMAGSTTKVSKNIWQFKFFETSQAVKVGEATTTLTCKVSGAEVQPTSWIWTPAKTSVYFEQSQSTWNNNEGSQESYIKLFNIKENQDFVCKAMIGGTSYEKSVMANAYTMKIRGDAEGVKYINKNSKAFTTFVVDLMGLKLSDLRITATAGSKTYKSWETSEECTWTKKTTAEGMEYTLSLLTKLTGTEGNVTFVTSRQSPPDYKPAKDLGHSVTETINLKFFSGVVTANSIVKVGGTASLTCTLTGADLSKMVHWSAGADTKLKEGEQLTVSSSYNQTSDTTTSILTTPSHLTTSSSFLCKALDFSGTSQIWYFEKKAYGTKAEAGKEASLVCAIVGSPEKPSEIYWIDGDDAKIKYKSNTTTSGFEVTDSVFDAAKGYQLTTLKITNAVKDKNFTCFMNVNNVMSQAAVLVDVIALSGSDVTVLTGKDIDVPVKVTGIASEDVSKFVSFSSGQTVYQSSQKEHISATALVNGTQTFTLHLKGVSQDAIWTFAIDIPAPSILESTTKTHFDKKVTVDVLDVSVTHDNGPAGKDVNLVCTVKGAQQDPTFLWHVNGAGQSNTDDTESAFNAATGTKTSTWKAGKVQQDTSYQCIIAWGGPPVYTLDTYFDMYTMRMNDAYLLTSSSKSITCHLDGAREETLKELQWFEESTELGHTSFTNTHGATTSTSVVTSTTAVDKSYKCKVGEVSLTKKIDLYTVSCTTGMAASGQKATMECTLNGLTSRPEISWDLPSGTYKSEIDDAKKAEGIIKITLEITALTKYTLINLSILSPDGNTQKVQLYAYITELTASLTTVNEGEKAKLTCKIMGASAVPTVVFKDGTTVFANVEMTPLVNGILTATAMTTNSVTADKTYTCEMTIGETKFTGSVKVDVIKLTATAASPVPVGSPYTFTCTYSDSQSAHEVIWSGATGQKTNTAGADTSAGKTGTSTFVVDKVLVDTSVVCSIGEANVALTLDTYDVTVTQNPTTKLYAGNTVSLTCTITGLTASSATTWKWLSGDNKEITSGVTSTNDNSILVLTGITNAQSLKCQSTKGGKMISKDINLNIRYVEAKAMAHKDHYMFTCSMYNFDQQPVPTYWTNSAGKYYYPTKEEVDSDQVETMTDVWDSVHGKGLISLQYKKIDITEDLVYTCKVDVTSPTKETISTVAKIDFITVSVPSNKVYVHTGETVTLTATFSGLAADYSNDIVWSVGDVSYTKANVTEAVKIESAYSGTGVTTKLILESYKGGDKDIVAMVTRHDVNPSGAKVTLHLDQFDIIFDNAYTTSSGSDVSVTCLVSNNKEAPESITVTGPTAFTSSLKNGSSNAGSFTKVSDDGTMSCAVKYGTYTATVQKKLELISISVSNQKWNTAGSSLFTATIGECSFNLVDDINWYIDDKKLTTGITNSYKTGQAAESILVVQGVQTDGNVRIKVGSDHASSASASKALEYYYTTIDKVRVEKDSSATITCKLESYTGTLLTKLEVTATDGTTNKNNVVTTSTAREVTLTIDKVTKKWTTTCLATVNGVTFTSSNVISQYTFTMKLNNQAISPTTNWVDLNQQSTMLCEVTDSDDTLTLPPHWFKSSTNVTTGVTTASNSKTTLSLNIPEDVAYTCQFHFDKDNWVRKNFTLVTKGCKTPSIGNATYTPVSELSKVAPGTLINFSCTNNTKFNLTGPQVALCGSTPEGTTNFYSYNTTLPTCKFVGDCTDVTKSFTSGYISPRAPFVNNKNYTFKCDSNYRLDGHETITCSNNNWQHSIPKCSFIQTKCGTEHWGKAYANFSGPYVQGDVVQVYCSTGYTNVGTGTLTCGTSGWDKSAECVKKESNQCAKITPSSGTMICHNAKAAVVTTYTTGVTCEISCETGYRAVGDTSKIECLAGGVWSRSTYPSCAAYQPPTHRDLEVSISFSTSYCANSAEQAKMKTAVSTTLTDIQQISCLKNKICAIANFTCAKESDKAFKVTFRLNQMADMSNTTVLSNSAAEIAAAKDTLSFTVTSDKKKRSAMQIMKIQKRGTTLTFSPSAVTKAAPVSTCPSNTFLENNLCVPCPGGYYLSSGACAACQIGSYNPNSGATQCVTCPAPKTTLAMGSSSETQCTRTCTVPQVDNVNSTTIPMGNKVEEGAIVYYTCDDGYKIKDAAVYSCAPDHSKPIVPTCESESKTIMWILIAVCGGIVILALFLLVCFCCAIKSRKKSDNSSSSISSASGKDNYILENKYASAEYSPRSQENSNV